MSAPVKERIVWICACGVGSKRGVDGADEDGMVATQYAKECKGMQRGYTQESQRRRQDVDLRRRGGGK